MNFEEFCAASQKTLTLITVQNVVKYLIANIVILDKPFLIF